MKNSRSSDPAATSGPFQLTLPFGREGAFPTIEEDLSWIYACARMSVGAGSEDWGAFQRLRPYFVSIALRYCRSREDAEERAADTFVNMWLKDARLVSPDLGYLQARAVQALRHNSSSAYRGARHAHCSETLDERHEQLVDHGARPEDEDQAMAKALAAMNRVLTSREVRVVVGTCIEGMSDEALAGELGTTVKNLHTIICRARHKLVASGFRQALVA